VDCTFGDSSGKTPDAAFGLGQKPGTLSIIRSMESAQYYPENDLAQARRWVSTISTVALNVFHDVSFGGMYMKCNVFSCSSGEVMI
jgi:hypothetical protein